MVLIVSAKIGHKLLVRYRMTLSAFFSMSGGMVSPIALAVLKLMIKSNFLAGSTGRFSGF